MIEKQASRGAEAAEMDRDGERYHLALEARQMACPYAGKLAGFADDAESWHELAVSGTLDDHHQPRHRHHHHLRLSCP